MKPVRILIVEDDPALLSALAELYRSVFAARGYAAAIEQASTVSEARRCAKAAKTTPYDFVSLDVNLGESVLTGLDVLETLKRFRSAWMVALLTGVETDSSLDATMGPDRADTLRKQLRRDAYARFPAERLLVVEKPSPDLPHDKARKLLADRLEQIAAVYEEVGRLRYVFRPIEVTSLQRVPAPKGTKAKRSFIEATALHWQIRFNCGEIRTLPDMSGFRTLHFLLTRDRDQSVTPEEALANEPKSEKTPNEPSGGHDPVAEYFEAQGIGWKELPSAEQDKLIRAAVSLKFQRYCEVREFQDSDELSPSEENELNRMTQELGPLADAAETGYQRLRPHDEMLFAPAEDLSPAALHQAGLHAGSGNYDKVGTGRRGFDSPAAQLFRARMKRVKDYLRENGFSDFAQHLEDHLQSTGADWSYNPPPGVEWTT